MFDELLISLIRSLAIPGNTGVELLALGALVAIITWRRMK